MIRLLYFASLRDQLDCSEEQLPAQAADIAALKEQLRQRGGDWARVFSGQQPVLAAVNQEMAQDDTPVKDGDEVGFFPPVTGG